MLLKSMQSQLKTIQPQFQTTRKKEKSKYRWGRKVVFIPVSWPLARSKLKGIQASVPGAGMVLAVSPAQWPKLKDTIWIFSDGIWACPNPVPDPVFHAVCVCVCVIFWKQPAHSSTSWLPCHFAFFSGDVCSALDDGWPLQLSGAAFWCSSLVQPSGAALWCISLLHLCSSLVQHSVSPCADTILTPLGSKRTLHLVMAGHY